jgi:hypothetical protein
MEKMAAIGKRLKLASREAERSFLFRLLKEKIGRSETAQIFGVKKCR